MLLRHDVLRSVFKETDASEVYQEVLDKSLSYQEKRLDKDFKEEVSLDINRVFNLKEEYPIRVVFYEYAQKSYILINIHHIAFDGWSVDVFIKDLNEIYESKLEQRESRLEELPISYRDYSIWQREYLEEAVLISQLDYWRDKYHHLRHLIYLQIIQDLQI